VTAVVDFFKYMETIGTSMEYFRPGCYNATQEAFLILRTLIYHDMDMVDQLFNPCAPGLNIDDLDDLNTFFTILIEPWKGAVQYTAPDAENSTIAYICDVMLDETNNMSLIERLSKVYYDYNHDGFNDNPYFGNTNCTPHDYEGMVKQLKMTDWSSPTVTNGARQWTWQTCTEFGYYQTTDSPDQPFGQHESVEYWVLYFCTEVFGTTFIQVKQSVDMTNFKYGATNGRERKVFLPNGSLDPWHNLGIYHLAPDSSDTVAFIQGTSHCYDMHDDLPTDPKQLTDVRANITQQIATWLSVSTSACSSFSITTILHIFTGIVCLLYTL